MAKTTIKMACGHEEEHHISGYYDSRRYRTERMCRDCWRRELARANRERILPSLTGTPKQIAWAESIRAKMIPEMEKLICLLFRGTWNMMSGSAILQQVREQTSAGWWIENRHNTLLALRDIAKKERTDDKTEKID
ncbi:MAG: hypothetical protein JRI22_23650 [Deltaproteobacteria bacterium]|nr:hypothetical protein [Deltaproteobacteria bacterium]